MMDKDMRSKKFIFIPFCLICQAFQANGIVKHGWHGMIKPIVEELVKQDVNLIQMSCPESQFGGYEKGLQRDPYGINTYDTPAFRQLCDRLASETTDMIKAILSNGYEVMAILGIEHSPSCAVKYQYTDKGTTHRSGIFIEILRDMLGKEGIQVPFIGINRRGIKKSLNEIKELFNKSKQAMLEFD
jgi:predicted secreted protein